MGKSKDSTTPKKPKTEKPVVKKPKAKKPAGEMVVGGWLDDTFKIAAEIAALIAIARDQSQHMDNRIKAAIQVAVVMARITPTEFDDRALEFLKDSLDGSVMDMIRDIVERTLRGEAAPTFAANEERAGVPVWLIIQAALFIAKIVFKR
jgi:hypothetical protein